MESILPPSLPVLAVYEHSGAPRLSALCRTLCRTCGRFAGARSRLRLRLRCAIAVAVAVAVRDRGCGCGAVRDRGCGCGAVRDRGCGCGCGARCAGAAWTLCPVPRAIRIRVRRAVPRAIRIRVRRAVRDSPAEARPRGSRRAQDYWVGRDCSAFPGLFRGPRPTWRARDCLHY